MGKRIMTIVISVVVLIASTMSVFALDDFVWGNLEKGQTWLCEDHHIVDDPLRGDIYCYECSRSVSSVCAYSLNSDSGISLRSLSGGDLGVPSVSQSSGGVGPSYVSMAAVSGMDGYYVNTTTLRKASSAFYRVAFTPSGVSMSGNTWVYFRFKLSSSSASATASQFSNYNIALSPSNDSSNGDGALYQDSTDGYIEAWFSLPLSSSVTPSYVYLDLYTSFTGNSLTVGDIQLYVDESSPTVPPSVDPDPEDPAGIFRPLIDWFDSTFGGVVDPETNPDAAALQSGIDEVDSALVQQGAIEDQVFSGIEQYSADVDPENLSWPFGLISSLGWIGTTFMSFYSEAGDIQFVIILSMTIGATLLILGRGLVALVRLSRGV